ncbi:MAG: HIT family protein [Actinomycetota bacterium]|jgi:diadenosine tetraphosphate (Ap4A) HIT family hydrolase|nr:HIT family protein [Actinomycetota bacterium]MDA8357567.1 HIT family protein [Actinomycetota bacterium]
MRRHAAQPSEQPVIANSCRFCDLIAEMKGVAIGTVSVIDDAFPVTPGHSLIVPRRHISDYFGMTFTEKCDIDRAILWLRTELLKSDPSIEGFNIGTNAGEVAGQTIAHAHIHLIPRRHGDTPLPRGGVRGVIPDRMQY